MKLASYGWAIIKNILILIIAIAVINSVQYSDNSIAVTLLILIYAGLNQFTIGYGYAYQLSLLALDKEFFELKKIIKKEKSGATDYRDEKYEVLEAAKHNNIKFYINSVGNSILLLIAIFNLLKNL